MGARETMTRTNLRSDDVREGHRGGNSCVLEAEHMDGDVERKVGDCDPETESASDRGGTACDEGGAIQRTAQNVRAYVRATGAEEQGPPFQCDAVG